MGCSLPHDNRSCALLRVTAVTHLVIHARAVERSVLRPRGAWRAFRRVSIPPKT
jgi:hypothetical protein